MNDYKEALDRIEEAYCDLDNSMSAMKKFSEDIHLLKRLVNKETPKKPIDIEFGPCNDLVLCCPTCEHEVVPIPAYHALKYYPRCPFCGQKLMKEDKDDC